jgi:hypothetical protein
VSDLLTDSLIRSVRSAFTDLPEPHPADGYCSDDLALSLGVVAVVLAVAAFIWAALP